MQYACASSRCEPPRPCIRSCHIRFDLIASSARNGSLRFIQRTNLRRKLLLRWKFCDEAGLVLLPVAWTSALGTRFQALKAVMISRHITLECVSVVRMTWMRRPCSRQALKGRLELLRSGPNSITWILVSDFLTRSCRNCLMVRP